MIPIRLLLAVVGAGIGLFAVAASAAGASPPSAPPIGDACLVGSWVATGEAAPGDWTWNNEVLPVSGLAGFVLTFTSDGSEKLDLNSSQPLIGDYHGHQVKIELRGTVTYQIHADGSQLTGTVVAAKATVRWYYDGVFMPGGNLTYSSPANAYSCSATRLRIEWPAINPGYGPTLDDLQRAPAATGSALTAPGSVVSTVGSTLATPRAVLAAPVGILVSALIALALVLAVTFPSHLFNQTYEKNHEAIRFWWEMRVPWLLRLRSRAMAREARGVRDAVSFAAIVVCGGVLAAILDPRFGPNPRTLALFAGAAFALAASSIVSAAVAGVYRAARHRAGPWRLHALPSGLLVAALCVLISRLTEFQPGYLYGLIGGVAFSRALSSREEGQVVAVTSIATLAVAFLAWLVWVPVSGQSSAHPMNFGWALASNFLAALFVSGMVGLLIGLVPLRFLPGEKLAGWHRGVWGAVMGLAAVAVIEVMLRPQTAGARVASVPFWTTVGLFVGFGAASILFWSYFRLREKPRAERSLPEQSNP